MTPNAPSASPIVPSVSASKGEGGAVSELRRSVIFQDYQQAFENITGLPLTLRASGSLQLPLRDSKRVNPFCVLMGRNNKSCSACLQMQQRVENESAIGAKTIECFAGLSESAVPVKVGRQLLGYLQTGQIFLRTPTKKRFMDALRRTGGVWGESELRELEVAYFQTRVVTLEHYDSVIRLLVIFAGHLATLSNQLMIVATTSELPAITRARTFIAENQGEDIHLRDVARAVNMSAFYFCKLFKEATGLTFLNYLTRVRIEVVKQMMLHVHLRVSEVAFAAGFQSISQFNRSFHRVAGESPTDFRERFVGAAFATLPQRGERGRQLTPAYRLSIASPVLALTAR